MRSLRIVRGCEVTFKDHKASTELPLTATAWDPSTDSIICAFGPSATASAIELRRQCATTTGDSSRVTDEANREQLQLITSWDAPCPLPDLPHDRIISLHHFADTLTSCVVLEGGDIIAVREDPQPGEERIEILGSVDAGITGAAWTPDEELLAITTRENTLLFMTRDFENAVNTAFSEEDLKMSQHVSVGWGKRETQFQGKRAKALRDPTVPESIDEGKLCQKDDGRVSLSWRGDGAYLAINSVHANTRRLIRVYSRDGTLDSVSEPVDFLEGALSWRPVGNLIAGIQRFQDRIDVVFFERNGLRHGQFTLRLTEEEMQTWAADIQLSWNIDSTVLAVIFMDRVQFWTTANYHYYLKQEVCTTADPSESARLIAFKWHQEKALKCTISTEVSLLDMELSFDVNRGTTVLPYDAGAVAVIDGKNLKLSALKRSNPPPPMYGHEIILDDNAVDVAFSKSGLRFVVLTTSGVAVYSWQLKEIPVKTPVLECTVSFANIKARHVQVAFVNEDEIYVLTCPRDSQDNAIERIRLDTKDSVQLDLKLSSISSIFTDVAHGFLGLYSQEQKRFFLTHNNGSDLIVDPEYHDYPSVDAAHFSAVKTVDDECIIITLTKQSALYANARLLAKNCTSFVLTSSHIIFTTSQHLLKFVHLGYVEALEVPGDTPEADERCRAIERGARIVTVVPSKFAVTLQMPRGNTEKIFPRALVLSGIRRLIDKLNYRAAFMVCRAQMVDMNILHDYNPTQFMASVPLFIDQVKDAAFIDEFLSRLSNEDVSQTSYEDTSKPSPPATTVATTDNKVNRICNAFVEVLAVRVDTHLRNLVTAHVCKFPPDLEAGLQLAAKLRDTGTGNAEEAVEHMCFLTDAHRLYDHALGLYDLELTLMVAQQAQRDPREYLPFLQQLQDMPEHRQRFEIDNHLGRHNKAIKSLHALQAYQDLKVYTVKHSLYSDALDLYADQPELFREMAELHADHLHDQSNHREAAIAYESLGLHESAYKSYKTAHLWQECLYNAALVPLDETAMRDLAVEVAYDLTETEHDYISAAKIHEQHLGDVPSAAHLLCRGSQFSEAYRLLVLHHKQDLIPNIVDSNLGEAMGKMVNFIADCNGQLNAQVPRIKEIRTIKATDPLKFFGGDAAVAADSGYDIPDNISLAPTEATTAAGRTLFTRYTGATSSSRQTSKARRKEERKRASGKKGTIYEEEYLINSVRRLIERVNGAVDETETIIGALLRRAMRERAAFLGEKFQEVQKSCLDSIDAVFVSSSDPASTEQAADEERPIGSQRPMGGEGVLWDSIHGEDSRTKSPPTVRKLKVFSLLGRAQ